MVAVLSDRSAPDRKTDALFLSLFLILFLLTFREFFFTGRVFFERDTTVVELPARKLALSLLKDGNLALWTDAYGNGQPFLANPKNAVFYPATLLYLLLPFFTAFKLFYLIHVVLGWLGLYRLGRSYDLAPRAAFLGASLFFFSGMYLSSFEFYNHIAALAWMPWILLCLNLEPRPGRPRFFALAVLWALLILAGSPEAIVLTAVLAAAQAFLRPGEWKKRLLAAALPFAAACLLTAVQLAPSFEMLAQTGREAQSVDWPLELLQLPDLTFPGVLGNDREPGHHDYWGWHLFDRHFPLYYSFYMGFGALLLFLSALRGPWDRRRKVLAAAGGLFFLLACGRYSPFFFLYRLTPFLASIRYPVKFFLGTVLCMSVLAGLGLEETAAGRVPGRKGARGLVVTAELALVLFLVFKGRILALINVLMVIEKDSSLRELGLAIGTGLVILAVYAGLFYVLARVRVKGPAAAWTLIVLAVLDPVFHNRTINPTVPASFYRRPPLLEELTPPVTIYRAEDYFLDRREKSGSNVRFLAYYRNTLYPLSAMGDGVRYLFNGDFYGTYPRRFGELVREAKKLPPEGQLKILRYLGCSHYIGDYSLFDKPAARLLQIEGFPVFLEKIGAGPARPHAVFSTVRATTPADKLAAFTDARFDPLESVITEGGFAPFLPPPAGESVRPASIVVRDEGQGRGRYSVDFPSPGIAVFPGNYARGWRAWVDGRRTEVFEANLFAKAIMVPDGTHEVVLRYLPASFVWGAVVSLVAVAALIAAAVGARIRLRRRARRASA
jgi:hypothetical protein